MEHERKSTPPIDFDQESKKFGPNKSKIRLGDTPDCDGNAVVFNHNTEVVVTLGNQFLGEDTRTGLIVNDRLVVLETGLRYALPSSGTDLNIGREILGGAGVSDKHLLIKSTGDRYQVEDLGSSNGTELRRVVSIIDGKTLETDERVVGCEIKNGDQLVIQVSPDSQVKVLCSEDSLVIFDGSEALGQRRRKLFLLENGQLMSVTSQTDYVSHTKDAHVLKLGEYEEKNIDIKLLYYHNRLYVIKIQGEKITINPAVKRKTSEEPSFHQDEESVPPKEEQKKNSPPNSKAERKLKTAKLILELDKEIEVMRKEGNPDDKSLYRKLARKYHPDLNKSINAQRMMQLVNQMFGNK